MRTQLITLAGLILIAVASYLYLFRTLRDENSALGTVTHHYRWGKPYEIRADSNRDGEIDFRALVSPEDSFSPHTPAALEFWEDQDFDGVFELHSVLNQKGEIDLVEIDEDGDGEYDKTLINAEARAFYKGLARQYRKTLADGSVPRLLEGEGGVTSE